MGMAGTIPLPNDTDLYAVIPLATACNGAVLIGDGSLNLLDSYDTVSGTLSASWQLTASPNDIVFDPASNTAYVALSSASQLAKVDLSSTTVTNIPLSGPAVRLALGNMGTVFALLETGGAAVVNGTAGTVTATLSNVSGELIAFDPRSRRTASTTPSNAASAASAQSGGVRGGTRASEAGRGRAKRDACELGGTRAS